MMPRPADALARLWLSFSSRSFPGGIAGQLALVVVLALALALGLTLALYLVLRPPFPPSPAVAVARIVMVARLIDAAPDDSRASLIASLNRGRMKVSLTERLARQEPVARSGPLEGIHRDLERELANQYPALAYNVGLDRDEHSILVTIGLQDGTALRFQTPLVEPPPLVPPGPLVLVAVSMVTTITFLSLWAARRITAPLTAFADAAERLGSERSAPPLSENGPIEIARLAHSFNLMQHRLQRFMSDQTRMLAAISHDLRTPITRLRLRAEATIEDGEALEKMLSDLQRMDGMIESILSFLREGQQDEPVDVVDLAVLLETICDEAIDLGREASYAGPKSLPFRCRPQLLGRAIRNVVENATKFGGYAAIRLSEDDARSISIVVEDGGPGIPQDELGKVFEPFYRVARDRNVDTGGTGLGLSIARAVVHAHGGEIELANRQPTGFRVSLTFPRRLSDTEPQTRHS